MSEKFTEFIGYCIKIKCHKYICTGEIVDVDANTIVLTNASINNIKSTTEFIGINQVLIQGMDIVRPPPSCLFSDSKAPTDGLCELSGTLNVYTSASQPPVIKRGGPSSAVHRNLLNKSNNTQEKVHKCPSSNFPRNNSRPRNTSSGSLSNDNHFYKDEIHKSKSNDIQNHRTRKNSNGHISKEPSWVNYPINGDTDYFDFDSNLALFNKHTINSTPKKNVTEGSDSSDSNGGIQISFKPKNGLKKEIINESIIYAKYDHDKSFEDFRKTTKNQDVFTELKQMGIIPSNNDLFINKKGEEDKLLRQHSFLQQPDIIQEVTKSQLSKPPDLKTFDNILSIDIKSEYFQNFTDFWKLDSDCKFPVFSTIQRDKLFECANKFGYDIRTIGEQVEITLSDFVINQVGGVQRLKGVNSQQIPKIAILLSRCQTSVFVASIARSLLNCGCHIIVYFNDSGDKINEDFEMEINLLKSSFKEIGRNNGFNYLTKDYKDLENNIFDYIVTGLEYENITQPLHEGLIKWCFKQKAPILTLNPNNISYIPWKVAVFVGVPTSSYMNLQIRTQYACERGFLKPRLDGVVGLEIDRMYKKPDGLVLLCNVNLPMEVYNLLNLNYKSPFSPKKNWIRLYREKEDLLIVE